MNYEDKKYSYEELLEVIRRQQTEHQQLQSVSQQLQSENHQLKEKINEITFTLTQVKLELNEYKRLIFGRKGERFPSPAEVKQSELDLGVAEVEEEYEEKTIAEHTRRTRKQKPHSHPGRIPFPDNIPRKEIVIKPEEDLTGYVNMGKEITEVLEAEPMKFYVLRYIRNKYIRKDPFNILIGKLPLRLLDKGLLGPGLLSQIITDKYVDHIPLNRQLNRFSRIGVNLKLSTLCSSVQSVLEEVSPVGEALKEIILSEDYLQVDETPYQVLDPSVKGNSHRGYLWAYHSPRLRLVWFDYRKGRGGEGPREMLKNFKGFLQTDGYEVYDKFDNERIRLFHCWAHARRYFFEAQGNDRTRSEWALSQIQQLYQVETTAREACLSSEQRQQLRQEKSIPVLNEMEGWLKENLTQVFPKSLIGKAIGYTLTRWKKLCLYTEDGRLEIDNNLVENAIRPVVLGRKNYLFAGSHEAAWNAGMIYSLLISCKVNGLNPSEWLKNLLLELPKHKVPPYKELLPKKKENLVT